MDPALWSCAGERLFRQIVRRFAGPAVEAAVLSSIEHWGSLPRPADSTHVYAVGPDADRILLFGAGGVAGLGVSSHELGPGGYLARLLSSMTGRGTEIEVDGSAQRSIARAARELAERDLSRYDAVVIQLGAREASGLRAPKSWRRDVQALLDALEATAPSALAIFFFGLPPLPRSLDLGPGVASLVTRHAATLNAVSRAACAATRVRFVDFTPVDAPLGSRFGGASTYAGWAEPIARELKGALDAAPSAIHEASLDEGLRLRSLQELVTVTETGDTRFDGVVGMARDLFGVAGAALNFIDSDCQWTYSGAPISRGVMPREGTFCNVTIMHGEILVLQDTDLDPRFVGHTNGTEKGRVRFYAGYPIESPNGQRIGALCVVDFAPRAFSAADAALLRELALRVQSLLWSAELEPHAAR